MPASFAEIREGFDCTEGGNGTAEAFVCRQTGEVYIRFDFDLTGEVDDELPEDLDDNEKYLPIPGKRELGLSKPLALDFAHECLPAALEEVQDIFSHDYRWLEASFANRLNRKRSASSQQPCRSPT